MQKGLLILCLASIVHRAIFLSFDDITNNKISNGDQLISTLGTFKAILTSNNCSFSLYQFKTVDYVYNSSISSPSFGTSKSCVSLQLKNGVLLADLQYNYLSLKTSNFKTTQLFLDENAAIRLIGIAMPSSINSTGRSSTVFE